MTPSWNSMSLKPFGLGNLGYLAEYENKLRRFALMRININISYMSFTVF